MPNRLLSRRVCRGSQFPEIDAYEKVYGGKKKQFTSDIAEAKFGEMVSEKNIYINELAKDYPEGTPVEDIKVLDKDAGLKIVTRVLGEKPGKQIRGFGGGRIREPKRDSLRAQQLEEQLEAEKIARQAAEERIRAADAAREESQRCLAQMLGSWEQAMQQLTLRVPGFTPPILNISPQTNSDRYIDEEEDD